MRVEETSKVFYPILEGFRGVAVSLVLISHFIIIHHFKKLIFLKLGYLGVNFFFVLSGFLITESLITSIYTGQKSILKNFYYRRTLRIFPIYYLSIALLFFVLHSGEFNQVLPWALTYTYNIGRLWFDVDSIYLSHFWSLCVEEQFYLLWPLLLIAVPRNKHLYVFLIAIVCSVAIKMMYLNFQMANTGDFILAFTPCSIDALALGGLLAFLKKTNPESLRKIISNYWVSVFLILTFWLTLFFTSETSYFYMVFGRLWTAAIAFYVVGWGALHVSNSFTVLLGNKLLRFIGKISYGIYVYHWILYFLLIDTFDFYWIKVKPHLGALGFHKWFFSFSFFTLLTLGVAIVSFFFIERPILSFKSRQLN